MSQLTKDDILQRIGELKTIASDLKIDDSNMWWRICSHKDNNESILSLNEQIGVSDDDMESVMGLRWVGKFKKVTLLSAGFILGSHSTTLYVSVCEVNDSSASPSNSSRMNPNSAIRRQVDVGLKEVIAAQEQCHKQINNINKSPSNPAPVAAIKVSPHTTTPASTSNLVK